MNKLERVEFNTRNKGRPQLGLLASRQDPLFPWSIRIKGLARFTPLDGSVLI